MSEVQPILRGFGMVIRNGLAIYWYIDKQGVKRWVHNDRVVENG